MLPAGQSASAAAGASAGSGAALVHSAMGYGAQLQEGAPGPHVQGVMQQLASKLQGGQGVMQPGAGAEPPCTEVPGAPGQMRFRGSRWPCNP